MATGLLAGVYFGVRLVSLFDTRVKVDDPGHIADIPCDSATGVHAQDSEWNDDENTDTQCKSQRVTLESAGRRRRHRQRDALPYTDALVADSDSDIDSDSGSDVYIESGSDYTDSDEDGNDIDSDIGTDDDYDGGAEETGAFLYRHFTIFLAPHPDPGKPNMIFMKATLLHTKGEDSNPRM